MSGGDGSTFLHIRARAGTLQVHTVDGSAILHKLIGSLSHFLQGFIHPRWLFGISSINNR